MAEFLVEADLLAKKGSKIRPLHGVNSGPKVKVFTYDMTPQYKDLGIPYVRLHDTEYPYGSGEFVDIHCVFPNFDADETKEENYNFALTDKYIEAIFEAGGEPLYRLGESIEHAPVKRHIYPPKDYAKWARICEHIIRHYCYGWANGHEWPIHYWEIYNEADGSRRNPEYNGTWIGSAEKFYELYAVTARHLKKCFPELKIGGCAWTSGTNEFVENFFVYMSKQQEYVPLDFVSWHCYYSDMKKLMRVAGEAEDHLKYYPEAESVFDEWNYMENWADQPTSYVALKDHRGAAFCAATLALLQTETKTALATYFEGDVTKEWSGLFSVQEMTIGNHGRKASVRPEKPYYAFKAFNELYKLSDEVNTKVSYTDEVADTELKATWNLPVVAAAKDGKVGILIANPTDKQEKIQLALKNLPSDVKLYMTDELKFFECIGTEVPEELRMRAHSFLFITNTI